MKVIIVLYCGGMCGQAVNTSNSGSVGPGFKPHPSCCFLRQGTLLHFVSDLHPGVIHPDVVSSCSFKIFVKVINIVLKLIVEACVAKQLTPQTLDV